MQPEYPRYAKEVQEILAHLANEDNRDQEPQTEIPDTQSSEPIREIHVIFVREEEDEDEQYFVESTAHIEDLDTAPLPPRPASNVATGIVPFGVVIILLCLTSLAVQFNFILNPYIVNVMLLAKSQQVALQGTLQLGRALNPITLSQSSTVPTTGHGHQDAKAATGSITFYNASFSSQTVNVGTVLTGADGIQVMTDETVAVPPNNPPQDGQATVSAHAISAGSAGNIAALDINGTVSSTLYVKNLSAFTGGQDERNFQTVAKSDIDSTASQLKDTLNQATQGALQGEIKQGEQLQLVPCNPTVTPDHRIGEEATQVQVTVSGMCSGIAYNDQELTSKVTQLLTTQARTKLGSGYSMLENPQITITSATTAKPVMLSFRSISTWVYALTTKEQRYIKTIIAGKYTQQALQLLHSLPGIASASLEFTGFGDNTRIPKDISHIHLLIFSTQG